MRVTVLAVLILFALPAAASAAAPGVTVSDAIARAVADPARQTDQHDDARRKVSQVMAFAQVEPGQKVLELIPGGGYFTRVFSATVGSKGRVYVVLPDEYAKVDDDGVRTIKALAANPHYANVRVLTQPAAMLHAPESVDLVFTSQNYHDYPDPFMGKVDPVSLDRQAFAALKPGGIFVVIDHVAPAGSGMSDTNTLHRIDPAIVKAQVLSAGFVFDGQSDALRNPADPHDIKVFDKAIRGHTDQFMYRFRKPVQ